MPADFVHLEVLGPRADVSRWLAVLQDAGSCHLADALRGMEAEPHVGRPLANENERAAQRLSGAAHRALQAVERVLPPPSHAPTSRSPGDTEGALPNWILGFDGGATEEALTALRDESLSIAKHLREALEQAELAQRSVRDHDVLRAAFDALERAGELSARGAVLGFPKSTSNARKVKRRLLRAGHVATEAHAERMSAVVVPAAAHDNDAVRRIGAEAGAHLVSFPADWVRRPLIELRASLDTSIARLRAAEQAARARLHEAVADRGARARQLLDSLDDVAARTRAMERLASTEHVAAARVYLRPEDEPALRAAMADAFADHVVIRPLDDADDTPTYPKQLAAYPFAALAGLLPSRLGEQGLTSMLALLAPVAVAARWGDMAGGLLLIAVGALLGSGAGAGSPRRDTAVLAQIAGLAALITGVLWGRMFGAAGEAWFGSGWGFLDAAPPSLAFADVLRDVGLILGTGALIPAVFALIVFLRARARGHAGRGLQVVGLAISGTTAFALAWAAVGAPIWIWGLAVLAAIASWVLRGPRSLVLQLGLDVVGVLRLAAVGTAGVIAAEATFAGWTAPHAAAIVLAPLSLGIACLAMVADPAYVAMGVPYDVALGGRQLIHPFIPFGRTTRGSTQGKAR